MTDPYIDPEMASIAAALAGSDAPDITSCDVADMRALLSALSPQGGPEMATVSDRSIANVPVREYRPLENIIGTILLFHGGGWVVGCLDDYDCFARLLAQTTRCRVISVGYRLAPENPFPAAVEDAWSVFSGLESEGPCFVLGDSAGGNLSAVVAQMARDSQAVELAGQILIYPSVAGDADSEAMHAFTPPMMPRADIAKYYDLYIPDVACRDDVRFAPIHGRLEGLAPALIITAGADLFAEEGRQYAKALAASGSAATLHEQRGALHAFLTLWPDTKAAHETMAAIGDFVSKQIDASQIRPSSKKVS